MGGTSHFGYAITSITYYPALLPNILKDHSSPHWAVIGNSGCRCKPSTNLTCICSLMLSISHFSTTTFACCITLHIRLFVWGKVPRGQKNNRNTNKYINNNTIVFLLSFLEKIFSRCILFELQVTKVIALP